MGRLAGLACPGAGPGSRHPLRRKGIPRGGNSPGVPEIPEIPGKFHARRNG